MVLQKMKGKNTRIALVGASNDSSKFGNRIYLDLRKKGYNVFPINPRESKIEGDKAYASIDVMDNLPDIVNFVVPPKIAIKIAQKAIDLGITHLWFQPGSESDELEQLLRESHGIKYLMNSCIMVETK
jgi:hypothetical protein|tara:strand:- start:554 stop:937 length:384 start_codon:yes stop_codon:yes gene_type:complete